MAKSNSNLVVTLVGLRGVKLPVETGMLLEERADHYVIQSVEKVGHGRGQKMMLRTYVLPKELVQYYYSEDEIVGEEATALAAQVPSAKKVPAKRGRKPKVVVEGEAPAAPKKRGRKPKVVVEAAAVAEGGEAPAAPKTRAPRKSTKVDKPPVKPAAGRANALFEEEF